MIFKIDIPIIILRYYSSNSASTLLGLYQPGINTALHRMLTETANGGFSLR